MTQDEQEITEGWGGRLGGNFEREGGNAEPARVYVREVFRNGMQDQDGIHLHVRSCDNGIP